MPQQQIFEVDKEEYAFVILKILDVKIFTVKPV